MIKNILNKRDEDLKLIEQKRNEFESSGFSCDTCNFVGKNKAGLSKHNETKHGKKNDTEKEVNQQKDDAGKDEFSNEDSEKKSLKCDLKEIKDAKKDLEKQKKFYCDDCLFRTPSQNEFKEHVKRRQHKEKQ